MASELDPQFEILLDHLKRNRGFDFTGYKRTSLMRRVNRRMAAVNIKNFVDYVDFLQVHPQEFSFLFNTILINVTSFFRDEEAWDYLKQKVIPMLIANNRGELRIWSAGCASGEEAYTIAILLCEALGVEQFHARVKIYATDVDEEALAQARLASYPADSFETMPADLRDKYFVAAGTNFVFRQDLRRAVIFGRHDLVQDAPISRLDLLTCRNTLMYLNAETQSRILARFHFALKDDGILFLGKAEMLLSHAALFVPLDPRCRIFSKAAKVSLRDRLLVMAQTGDAIEPMVQHVRLRELSFEDSLVAQIVIDEAGVLRIANRAARQTFRLTDSDIGKPFQDLEISYRPVELRSLTEKAFAERRTVQASKIAYKLQNNELKWLDLQISPLILNGGNALGLSIAFHDVTDFHALYDSLNSAHEELETTNEELQSTNEELETTNEELQSMNEELETTNEELQSINEELETTNEELQSSNEELETTNVELRELTEEVNSANIFLESILGSMRYAVITLDAAWRVRVWNQRSSDLWGLLPEECVGHSFFDLDIGLPVAEIRDQLLQFVEEKQKYLCFDIDAIDRKGRHIKLTIRVTPLLNSTGAIEGTVLLMDRSSVNSTSTDERS